MFTVSRRIGYASVAFTMDRYGHVLRESQGISKGVMDAYLCVNSSISVNTYE